MIQNETNNIKEPRITLVGAGPGDAELITLKGIKALQTADVVLYDALVNEDLLGICTCHATKVYVGKRSGDHSFSQDNINKLMVDYALNYGHVVRLKGGDPFVFGRGHEELDHAAELSIPTQVVPGISSSIGVPGLQGIPVTHRGLSESFWVVTGTTSDGKVSADLYDAAKTNATIVVLMGIHKLAKIAEIFKNEGKNKLPVAVIQSGTTVNEKVVIGVADTIADLAEEKASPRLPLLFLAKWFHLHPNLNW
jgi:uroporphyrin-III C-methyltransferase